MISRLRLFALVVAALVAIRASAAWPFDFEAQELALNEYFRKVGGEWVIGRDTQRRITTLTGKPLKLSHLPIAMQLSVVANGAASLRGRTINDFDPLVPLSPTPGTERFEFPQFYQTGPDRKEGVENASIVINVHGRSGEYDVLIDAFPPGVDVAEGQRDAKDAEDVAQLALIRDLRIEIIDVRRENGERARMSRYAYAIERYGDTFRLIAVADPATKLLAYRSQLWRVRRVAVKLVVQTEGRELTLEERDYDIDATTLDKDLDKVVVRTNRRLQFVRGKGNVFDPNPRNTLNRPLPTREVDPEFPPYFKVRLKGLARAQRGRFVLEGTLVRLVDRNDSNPDGIVAEQAPDFSGFRQGERFAAVMAYYHVHKLQRYFSRLGFGAFRHVPLDVDVVYGNGDDAGYHPASGNTPAYLSFGRSNAIYIAEDGDVIAHEYGHTLLGVGGAGRYGGNAESLAMTEGFSDYLAMSTFSKQTIKNRHCLACFAEWLVDDCYRRLDERTSYREFDAALDEHENGKIWSAMLFRVFSALNGKRKKSDRLILTAHINRAPLGDEPTMGGIAEGIVISAKKRDQKRLCVTFADFHLELPYCRQRFGIGVN